MANAASAAGANSAPVEATGPAAAAAALVTVDAGAVVAAVAIVEGAASDAAVAASDADVDIVMEVVEVATGVTNLFVALASAVAAENNAAKTSCDGS